MKMVEKILNSAYSVSSEFGSNELRYIYLTSKDPPNIIGLLRMVLILILPQATGSSWA